MAAVDINNQQFDELISGDKPVLVEFWAPWCSYCRRIGPAYDKVAEREDILAVKVNIDEAPQLASREHIDVIPTLVLYRGGQALGSIVAPESKARIDAFLRETLSK